MDELVIPSKSKTETLVFMFHGYGSNKDNLYPIGEKFSETLTNAEIHLADGIEPCEEASGFKWFGLESNDLTKWGENLSKNELKIMNYINSVKDSKNLSYRDIILSGFSQGAMLSLAFGIFNNVKAVISFSGLILAAERYLKKADTKVLLAHGSEDSVIPVGCANFTKEALTNLKIDTKLVIADGLDHAINEYLLNEAVDFLREL